MRAATLALAATIAATGLIASTAAAVETTTPTTPIETTTPAPEPTHTPTNTPETPPAPAGAPNVYWQGQTLVAAWQGACTGPVEATVGVGTYGNTTAVICDPTGKTGSVGISIEPYRCKGVTEAFATVNGVTNTYPITTGSCNGLPTQYAEGPVYVEAPLEYRPKTERETNEQPAN